MEKVAPLLTSLAEFTQTAYDQSPDLPFDAQVAQEKLFDHAKELALSVLDLQEVAGQALALFLQENWTGPPIDRTALPVNHLFQEAIHIEEETGDVNGAQDTQTPSIPVGARCGDRFTPLHRALLAALERDGETVYQWIRAPLLLLFASVVFDGSHMQANATSWTTVMELRVIVAHQLIMDISTASLHSTFDGISKKLLEVVPTFTHRELAAAVLLELSHAHMMFIEYRKANEVISAALAKLGMDVDLTGALGKRTKFQQSSIAQLSLRITRTASQEKEADATPEASKEESNWFSKLYILPPQTDTLPKEKELMDDTLLEDIQFDDGNSITNPSELSIVEQAALLASFRMRSISNARHDLDDEELIPYLNAVLGSPKAYSIQMYALWMKTRLEKTKTRRIHRSTEQLGALGDNFTESECPAALRLAMFSIVQLPPYWKLQKEIAQRYITLGLARDALVLYERLEYWEGVISAHQMLGQDNAAEAVVRARLDVDPNDASLWCALGEILRKEEHFEHAWELSGGRLAQAMRSLGLMLLRQAEHVKNTQEGEIQTEKYKKAADCLEKYTRFKSQIY